jgi:hypothetical protein
MSKSKNPPNPDNTELGEIDMESEQALLLEEAYNLGYHKVKNGCLIPLTEKLERQINALISKARIDPFDFVEPCEPDCSPERHAYHQGQWDMAARIKKHQEENL